MAMVHAAPEPVIDGEDDIFKEIDKFEKRGNWTEERHEVLKNLTLDDIFAEAERIQAANPGRFKTPEELRANLARIQEERAAKYNAKLVGV